MGRALKLLAIADLHGQVDKLQNLDVGDAGLIVVCGDLHNAGGENEVMPVVRALADLGLPVLIVPGNMDPRPLSSCLWEQAGFISLHGRAYLCGDFGFIGMGGIVARGDRSPDNPNRYYHRDEDAYEVLRGAYKEISSARRKIVVTHQPPFGFLDTLYNGEPSGCHSLRRFMEKHQPDLMLCGHIHEARGEAWLGKTLGVNVGELRRGYSALIELADSGNSISVVWNTAKG